MKRITRFNPFGYESFDYLESWYQDMARKGLIVKDVTGAFSVFEESEPVNRRYRILPISITKISGEEKELYESTGWKYVQAPSYWSMFYNDDIEAEEIFTDDDSWYKRYKKALVLNTITIPLVVLFILYFAKQFFWFSDPTGPYHTWDVNICDFAIMSIWFLTLILLYIIKMYDLFRFNRLMKNYDSVNHNIPYKRKRNCFKILFISMFLPIIIIISSFMITHQVGGGTMLSAEKSLIYQNDDLVRFSNFDKENWDKYNRYIFEGTDKGKGGDYFIFKDRTLIEKNERERFSVFENNGDDNKTLFDYDMGMYKFISKKTATGYINEEIGAETHIKDDIEAAEKIRIDCYDVDYAGYYKEEKVYNSYTEPVQYLYLRNGKKAIIVFYSGNINLLDKLPLFVEKLQ